MVDSELQLNPEKAEMLMAGAWTLSVLVGAAISLREQLYTLGLLFNPGLYLEAQVTLVARHISQLLKLVHQLHPLLDKDCLARVRHAVVMFPSRNIAV